MKKNIKMSFYVRLGLIIGPSLILLLYALVDDRIEVAVTGGTTTSRRLMSVKDQDNREKLPDLMIQDVKANNNSSSNRKAISENLKPLEFSRRSQKSARIVAQVIVSCYCFLMLAIICDEYFIGSIEILCQRFRLREDVYGTLFMAMATSAPELFISCVGTFITEGDIGVGTIVGSAVFNVVAVPACCGLFTRTPIQLERWSVTRDCVFYGISVIGLVAVIYDYQIMWYEAAALVGAYGIYLIFMYNNVTMTEKARVLAQKVKRRIHYRPYNLAETCVSEMTPLIVHKINAIDNTISKYNLEMSEPSVKIVDYNNEYATSPWRIPTNGIWMLYLIRWPITFTLWLTIPDSKRFKRFYVLTFINCVLWIGCISFFVVFLSTTVDSVMGLTFLAAGTSLPETVSSVILTAQGYGTMGFSNSIGSNIFDILLCLGLPWLIKTLIAPTVPGQPWITLKSTGIHYTTISMLTTLFAVYISFAVNKFKLDRKIGICCLTIYLFFVIFAALADLSIFFTVIPTNQ